jgi:alpha-galactosidase
MAPDARGQVHNVQKGPEKLLIGKSCYHAICSIYLGSSLGSCFKTMLRFLTTGLLATLCSAATLAPTPPMGWNSWDAYGTTVTEPEVKANADVMAARLKQHGWRYIVVDIQWSEPDPHAHGYRPNADLLMDRFGRLIPAPNRFPSAESEKGFLPLANYIHSEGLLFGIHIMRGIPRRAVDANLPVFGTNLHASDIADKSSVCRWNTDMYGVDMSKPGGQAYYDSLVQLYASWGVDYIKADDMATPFHGPEITALHTAIVKSGRPIVLSLSPGPADTAKASFYAANANLWRISDDFWDRWDALLENFALLRKWSSFVHPGAWPDADMLPLGRIGLRAERGEDRKTRFTPAEQRTLLTLWSVARSPLMFGGDLPSLDPATLSLIANDEVLAVDQHGTDSRELFSRDGAVAWTSKPTDGNGLYLAVFNTNDNNAQDIKIAWHDLGLSDTESYSVRDLWTHKDMGKSSGSHTYTIEAHGAGLYRVGTTVPSK